MEKIPLNQCIKGRVYKIHSRNLSFGVYDGNGGFIGIRTKFGSRYLFTEYHWEYSGPFGTVRNQVDLEIDIPENIQVAESLGIKDEKTDKWLHHIETKDGPAYAFMGSNKPLRYPEVDAYRVGNKALFDFLKEIENTYSED